MVPDELALSLAETYAYGGSRVLDPFCGSGRLLMAAAAKGASCTGYDVNPLARLLTSAKAVTACIPTLSDLAIEAAQQKGNFASCPPIELRGRRFVRWFSDDVASELSQIVEWINKIQLPPAERLVVAASLSAATRDASWCRKNGWKLHRLGPDARNEHKRSAWDCFASRLKYYIQQAPLVPLAGTVVVANRHAATAPVYDERGFDLILTSPPYGDSKTTVQYGAASGLCLDIVSRINGLETYYAVGSEIDGLCLGSSAQPDESAVQLNLEDYWGGATGNEAIDRVKHFLHDFAIVCRRLASMLHPGGTAVIVVGRRSAGGFRLGLDRFCVDALEQQGLRTISIESRSLLAKRLPARVNRFARSKLDERRKVGLIDTMAEEIVLTFRKDFLRDPDMMPSKSDAERSFYPRDRSSADIVASSNRP